jgi:hypothetical protein
LCLQQFQSNRVGQAQLILRLSSLGQSLIPHLPTLTPSTLPTDMALSGSVSSHQTKPSVNFSSASPTAPPSSTPSILVSLFPNSSTAAPDAITAASKPAPAPTEPTPPGVAGAPRFPPQPIPRAITASLSVPANAIGPTLINTQHDKPNVSRVGPPVSMLNAVGTYTRTHTHTHASLAVGSCWRALAYH